MAIRIRLNVMMAKRNMRSKDLAKIIGVTQANLSILKTGKARAIRFTTLDAICNALECSACDIIEFTPDSIEKQDLITV